VMSGRLNQDKPTEEGDQAESSTGVYTGVRLEFY